MALDDVNVRRMNNTQIVSEYQKIVAENQDLKEIIITLNSKVTALEKKLEQVSKRLIGYKKQASNKGPQTSMTYEGSFDESSSSGE